MHIIIKNFWKNCTGGLGLAFESLVIVHNSDFVVTDTSELCWAARLAFVLICASNSKTLSKLPFWTTRPIEKITVTLSLSYLQPSVLESALKLSRWCPPSLCPCTSIYLVKMSAGGAQANNFFGPQTLTSGSLATPLYTRVHSISLKGPNK